MRFGNRLAVGAAVLAGLVCFSDSAFGFAPIEAEKGKQYSLTKKHGPWMIMVASFSEPPSDRKAKEGLTPDQAADELVFDLRKKGIPAYKYARDEVVDRLGTSDRVGRQRSRAIVAQKGSVCVLAGNYQDPENEVAQRTLEFVKNPKKFMPSFLGDSKATASNKNSTVSVNVDRSGAVYRTTPGRPSPLSGAFLTLNPMLTPEEAAKKQDDPLLLKLNGSADHSLLQNSGKYTVVIATFSGQSQTQVGRIRAEDSNKKWNDDSLDTAGQNAFELCTALRQGKFNVEGDPTRPPRYQPVKAWVYHDRYRSYVTVGEFETPSGDAVKKTIEMFAAKKQINPTTKSEFMAGERLIIPSKDPKKFPDRMWIFDPQPIVMPVPKIKL